MYDIEINIEVQFLRGGKAGVTNSKAVSCQLHDLKCVILVLARPSCFLTSISEIYSPLALVYGSFSFSFSVFPFHPPFHLALPTVSSPFLFLLFLSLFCLVHRHPSDSFFSNISVMYVVHIIASSARNREEEGKRRGKGGEYEGKEWQWRN